MSNLFKTAVFLTLFFGAYLNGLFTGNALRHQEDERIARETFNNLKETISTQDTTIKILEDHIASLAPNLNPQQIHVNVLSGTAVWMKPSDAEQKP